MKRGMQSNAALSGCESRTISLEVDKLHDGFLDNVLGPLWLQSAGCTLPAYKAAHEYMVAVRDEIERLQRECRAKQAEIDRLMLECCPEAMAPRQLAKWEKHQMPVKERDEHLG